MILNHSGKAAVSKVIRSRAFILRHPQSSSLSPSYAHIVLSIAIQMAPRTQSLLPKQTPAEVAEQARRDAEDEVPEVTAATAAVRVDSNASQYTNDNGGHVGINGAVDWFAIAQSAAGLTTNSMMTPSSMGFPFPQVTNSSWGELTEQGFGNSPFGLNLMATHGYDSTGKSMWRRDQYQYRQQ